MGITVLFPRRCGLENGAVMNRNRFVSGPVYTLIATALLAALPASANQLYFNDFESNSTTGWSVNSLDSTPGTVAHPSDRFLGRFARNDMATLELGGLTPHSTITLEFDFYAIRSWDGNNEDFGADLFLLFAEGVPQPLLLTSFSNTFLPGFTQTFPFTYDPSNLAQNAPQTGAFETGTLGYLSATGTPEDAVYRMSFTFAHTSSTLRLNFLGWDLQDVGDEAWGLDNVRIQADVPEPSTFVLLGAGGFALTLLRRRRLR